MKKRLEELCVDLNLSFEAHGSHGFYLDVLVGGRGLMLDASPESFWHAGVLVKSWEKGILLVRDHTHHYSRPTHLAEFDLNTASGYDDLRVFLTDGYVGRKSVSSITGEPL